MTSVSGSGTRMSYFRVHDGVLSRMPNLDPKLYPEQLIDFGNTSGYFFITAFWYWSHLGGLCLERVVLFRFRAVGPAKLLDEHWEGF